MTRKTVLRIRRAEVVVAVVLLLTSAFAPGAWAASKYKVLYKFKNGVDGGYTRGGLIFDRMGNLYGTTAFGGASGLGTVFKLTPNAKGRWTESVLYSFKNDRKDGNTPFAGLTFDQAGNLYGTTAGGGAFGNYGAVFELAPNGDGTWTESVLHSFNGSDGYEPYTGNLIFDTSGNLYGGTNLGGLYGQGVVFQLVPNGDGTWSENVVYPFGAEGTSPTATLVFDQKGNLYGTAFSGGATGDGAAFQLTPNGDGTWSETVLHWLTGSDDCHPLAGLIFDQVGNLYGTAGVICGNQQSGTVFELTPNGNGSWTENTLHAFKHKDGRFPYAGLIFDPAGNLYGTTFQGGAYGYGTVFKLTPNGHGGWTENVLHSFRDRPGANPWAGLVIDAAGNLYGTTAGDGKTGGCVFEITP